MHYFVARIKNVNIGIYFGHNDVCELWTLLFIRPQVNATGHHWCKVNISSGDGLVPSGNKPSPESMLTKYLAMPVQGAKASAATILT